MTILRQGLATAIVAVLLVAAAGCGGDDEPATALTPDDVRANLEDAGYAVDEDITDGANQSLPPDGEINADLYFSVESGPSQEPGLTAGVYFFASTADADTVAKAFEDSLHEVRDTRLYNYAGDDEETLSAFVDSGEGD